jgi:ribosomal protein S8
MINRINNTERKNVVRYQTQTVIEPKIIVETVKEISKVITTPNYITDEETILIVKNVGECEITLNSKKNNKIVIKSLTTVLVKSDVGQIDEDWDELLLEKGACVQFQFVEGNWYITSSDGLKMT